MLFKMISNFLDLVVLKTTFDKTADTFSAMIIMSPNYLSLRFYALQIQRMFIIKTNRVTREIFTSRVMKVKQIRSVFDFE